jgi:hypothetical protein
VLSGASPKAGPSARLAPDHVAIAGLRPLSVEMTHGGENAASPRPLIFRIKLLVSQGWRPGLSSSPPYGRGIGVHDVIGEHLPYPAEGLAGALFALC